jgi:hypothetical protein
MNHASVLLQIGLKRLANIDVTRRLRAPAFHDPVAHSRDGKAEGCDVGSNGLE